MLAGLSVSPIAGVLISSLMTVASLIVVAASLGTRVRGAAEINDRVLRPTAGHVAIVACFLAAVVFGVFAGVRIRTFELLSPDMNWWLRRISPLGLTKAEQAQILVPLLSPSPVSTEKAPVGSGLMANQTTRCEELEKQSSDNDDDYNKLFQYSKDVGVLATEFRDQRETLSRMREALRKQCQNEQSK